MRRKEFVKSVNQRVKAILKRGDLKRKDVVINHSLPTVAVGDKFFAQGQDAQELIDGVPDDINEVTWLIYYLDSGGIVFGEKPIRTVTI